MLHQYLHYFLLILNTLEFNFLSQIPLSLYFNYCLYLFIHQIHFNLNHIYWLELFSKLLMFRKS
jgi:hypothetical protein